MNDIDHPLPFEPTWLRGTVVRVIDGDTYHVRVYLAFHAEIVIPIRLLGVDTPELTTEDGKAIRQIMAAKLQGKPVLVLTYRDRQSFARWIAQIQFQVSGGGEWLDLADWLFDNGYAKRISLSALAEEDNP